MPGDSRRCDHGRLKGRCWHCLTPEEQAHNREVWARLELRLPQLKYERERVEAEVREGKVIPLSEDIVLPHTIFRRVVDAIHEDNMERENERPH